MYIDCQIYCNNALKIFVLRISHKAPVSGVSVWVIVFVLVTYQLHHVVTMEIWLIYGCIRISVVLFQIILPYKM